METGSGAFVTAPSSPVCLRLGGAKGGGLGGGGLGGGLASATYHPNSGLPRPGFLGALSLEQEEALNALEAEVRERGHWERMQAVVIRPAEDESMHMLRFLRARHFNVERAFDMLVANLDVRESLDVPKIASSSLADVLGCDEAVLKFYQPMVRSGNDKEGRPVVWSKQGALDIEALNRHTSIGHLDRAHVWEQEHVSHRLCAQSAVHGASISQVCAVVDLKGFNSGLMTRKAMSFISNQVLTDSNNYPERTGRAIIINAPYVFSLCWLVISALLDAATNAKIQLISAERYWRPVLLEAMEEDQIPLEYGGTSLEVMRDVFDGAPPPPTSTPVCAEES